MPPQEYSVEDLIRREADAAGVPPELALAVAEQESSFNPTALGPPIDQRGTRAIGTFQLLPSTAAMLKVDPNDPLQNIQGGARYLRQLLDRHNGDLDKVLAEYGGVRSDTKYVPAVRARINKYTTPTPGTPPPAPPPPTAAAPTTWSEEHPYLSTLAETVNPAEPGGRQNIAGGVGAAVGGGLGALTAPVTGPWGARVGSVVGAGLGGGAEQLLVEETGLGPKLGQWLPRVAAGTVPGYKYQEPAVATPPPAPDADSTLVGRTLGAAGTQAAYDVAGQTIMAPLRWAGKAALETRVGRTAAGYYTTAKKTAVETLTQAMEALRGARDATAAATAQQGRALTGEAAARTAAAREAARGSVEATRTAVGEKVGAAQAGKQTGVRKAAAGAREAMDAARADAEAAEQAYREQLQTGIVASPPSEIAAGRAVAETFQGPGQAARDLAGQAVKEAAQSGPPVSIKPLQDEARRIAEQELLPPEQAFPRQPRPEMLEGRLGEAPPGAIEGEVLGEAPPAPPPMEWPTTNSAATLWEHTLADAKASGYQGPVTRLRQFFNAKITEARGLVADAAQAAEEFGPRGLLRDIANNGGLGPDKTFPGEHKWFRQGTTSRLGKVHDVPGVIKKTGGLTFDEMAERLRTSDPKYARFTSGKELVDELTNVVSKAIAGEGELTLSQAASQAGIRPGTPWWEQALAEQQKERLGGLSQQITDAQLQQIIKHPALGVIGRILNAPENVDFYTAHLWKSQLQQALSGTYDDVVKSQVTNITQHLTRLLRESLAGHEPYNAATAAYSRVAKLFTEGHAPLIRQVATEAPEKIAQAINANDPSAAQMLVRVLTEQAEVGGGAAGRAQGEEALQAVQSAWVHRNILSGPLDTLSERVANLKLKPDFVSAFLDTPYARGLLDEAGSLGTALKRLQSEGEAKLLATREAGRAGVQTAAEAGERAVAEARRVGAQEIRGARAAGRGRVAAAEAEGAAVTEAQKRAAEAGAVGSRQAIREKGAELRLRKAGTPEEQAFAKSTLTAKYANAARLGVSRQVEWAIRASLAGMGFAAFGPTGILLGTLLRTPGRASEADLLRYVIHSGPLTRAVIKNLFSPGAKLAYNQAVSTALKAAGTSMQPNEVSLTIQGEPSQVATPPPRP